MNHAEINNQEKTGLGYKKVTVISILLGSYIVVLFLSIQNTHASFKASNQVITKPHTQKVVKGNIEPWMTFDYINVVFGLPQGYLQQQLDITDPKYPNLQIGKFAKNTHTDKQQIISHIKQAINALGEQQ